MWSVPAAYLIDNFSAIPLLRLTQKYRETLRLRWYTVSSGRTGENFQVCRTLHTATMQVVTSFNSLDFQKIVKIQVMELDEPAFYQNV